MRSVRPEIELALARQGGPGGEGLESEWRLGERPARGLRKAISEFYPDLIHSHGPSEFLTVCANELTGGRIPVIYDADARTGRGDDALERRAVEESDALIVPSQALLEEIGSRYMLPPHTCVFPTYPLARELPKDDHQLSAEAGIGGIASLYETLVREPIVGVIAGG
jgi:hypothetical protein